MIKLHSTIAAVALVLCLTGVAAAQTQPRPTTPGGNPDPGCQVNCDPTEPGEPFIPFDFPDPEGDPDCQIDCDPGKSDGDPDLPDPQCQINCDPKKPGDDPKKPGGNGGQDQAALDGCGAKLGYLRDVTVAQIEGVGSDDQIDVVPVCRSQPLADEQESVAGLRPALAGNAVIDSQLGRKGYNPENVVGVIVNGPQVVLYVHQL